MGAVQVVLLTKLENCTAGNEKHDKGIPTASHGEPSVEEETIQSGRIQRKGKERRTSRAHFATFFVSAPPAFVRPAFKTSATHGELRGSFSCPFENASARSPSNPMAERKIGSVRSWSVRARWRKLKTLLMYGRRMSTLPPVLTPPTIPVYASRIPSRRLLT